METTPRIATPRRLVPLLLGVPAAAAAAFLVTVALRREPPAPADAVRPAPAQEAAVGGAAPPPQKTVHQETAPQETAPQDQAAAAAPPAPPAGEAAPEPAPQRAETADPADGASAAAPAPVPPAPQAAEAAPALEEQRAAAAEPGVDLDGLRQTIELYRRGDLAGGDRARANLTDPASRTLSEWVAVRYGGPVGSERILAFIRQNPDWPVGTAIRRRAEDALLAERKAPAAVRAFFAERKPVGPAGKLALALALRAGGFETVATGLVREMWHTDAFGRAFEDRVLETFPDALAQVDHRDRMEMFLFKESWASALRAAANAGKDYVLLAKARQAVGESSGGAQKALDAVPAPLRYETSYLFAKAQFLRRNDKPVEAAHVVADVGRDPVVLVDGDEWWVERRLIARKLLDQGDAKAAYEVVRNHAAASTEKRIEAEFHAGWIALRFLDDPAAAARHFAEAARIAVTPISIARTAYWQGRAGEAAGQADAARRFYERAAGLGITWYGQLARTKLGLPETELRTVPASAGAAFDSLTVGQALRRLYQADLRDLAFALCADLAAGLTDAGQLDALGRLAGDNRDARALLTVGKTALQRGFPLDAHAYPTIGVPEFEPLDGSAEKAMVLTITRQESAFDAGAQSHRGARGLMQLMPATAQRTAKRFGVPFATDRLLDPSYNARLGAAHLGELMQDWKGSHLLTFAAYNAGGPNVSKWIRAYGDPRAPGVDLVDWIERIPFHETRNYVQRALESLQVYRARLAPRGSARAADAAAPTPALLP